jgi:two-component system chemotaxis response regulator CheB
MKTGRAAEERRDIVAIGASAGGLHAISALLHELPGDLAATVFVVMHRPASMTSHLVSILAKTTALRVREAHGGDRLQPGVCYVGMPDRHLALGPDHDVRLLADGAVAGNNIDLLFQSLAQYAGPRTIGVIMSGMLSDGSVGLGAIKQAGGITLVQEPAEAEFSEMPANAIRSDGPVDLVGKTRELAAEICKRTGPGGRRRRLFRRPVCRAG